jgi:hypothetical protein
LVRKATAFLKVLRIPRCRETPFPEGRLWNPLLQSIASSASHCPRPHRPVHRARPQCQPTRWHGWGHACPCAVGGLPKSGVRFARPALAVGFLWRSRRGAATAALSYRPMSNALVGSANNTLPTALGAATMWTGLCSTSWGVQAVPSGVAGYTLLHVECRPCHLDSHCLCRLHVECMPCHLDSHCLCRLHVECKPCHL